jgi:hypothetical protein
MANESGIQWSGLETPAMKEARCSLLIPVDVTYQPEIKTLPPSKVVVRQDRGAKMSQDYLVDFWGSTLLQLVPNPGRRKHPAMLMPVTLTIAGKCHYTLDNYKDFCIMMRTHEESEELNLPRNSEYEWPDVRSLLLCPLCSATAQIPDGTGEFEYWMVFYPLLQVHHGDKESDEMTLATRTICRLVCLDCMTQLLDGMFITVKQTEKDNAVAFSLSAMEILQEAGTVSFLQDGPPRPDEYAHVDDPIDAWTLYSLWESTGAWEALQNDYRSALARSMTANPAPVPKKNGITKDRYGRKCGHCEKMHGKKDKDGAIIRLNCLCKQCKNAYYCSNECKHAAWAVHSLECTSAAEEAKYLKVMSCNACHKSLPYTNMKKCSRCRSAVYCSVECQTADWKTHKVMCKKHTT